MEGQAQVLEGGEATDPPIFEQTKAGLARRFLAIFLATSSKGGISVMELERQMGLGSYQTARAWLHESVGP